MRTGPFSLTSRPQPLDDIQEGNALPSAGLEPAARQAVRELMHEGESANTRNSYQSAMRYWSAWHALRFDRQMQLPLDVACVLQFIIDHAQRQTGAGLASEMPMHIDRALVEAGYKAREGPLSHNTLVHRMAVLSKAHQVHGLANPCQDGAVRELMSRTRKAYARRGEGPAKKDALTRDLLEQLLDTCDDSLRGRRDRALLLFAWSSGGRRRSEVAGADMRHLRSVGPQEFIYTLAHSKTNQSGRDAPENHKPVTGRAAQALADWLRAAAIQEGPIFRRIRKGGHVGEPLSPAAVRDIVKQRCALAGVEGDFSAHSLRSGFVTEAGRQNVPLPDTMALTGHSSVNTVLGYFRADSALSNRAARLLDAGDDDAAAAAQGSGRPQS
ncbi:site-specific integrase [Delftia tsuruhatensis]|uniref:site-specific integrase n=1 Tax=Delftia tsuruhatensis TaxID=180282 RepID=UPI0024445A2B|nr:site-specific integrase [Delftia tsuruhatensis]MDH0775495.1 site-specific integrase [Delftia tsuruhatensis]MDH1461048.1 site-specific integrase [Delftia tsuruhatensis]MDH1825493.1 site-specific integrase [Delftia tsuruhatensis]WGG13929.1 site-specific integrase [Delftia tsuruhatensis]